MHFVPKLIEKRKKAAECGKHQAVYRRSTISCVLTVLLPSTGHPVGNVGQIKHVDQSNEVNEPYDEDVGERRLSASSGVASC